MLWSADVSAVHKPKDRDRSLGRGGLDCRSGWEILSRAGIPSRCDPEMSQSQIWTAVSKAGTPQIRVRSLILRDTLQDLD